MVPSSRAPTVRGRTRWSYGHEYDGVRPRTVEPGYNGRIHPPRPVESSHELRRSGARQRPRRVDQPAAGPASPVPRARHDVRHPDRHRGADGLRPGVGVRHLAGRPDPRPDGPGGGPRHPHRLAVAPRPGARRAPRGGAPDPRGRLRPRARRGAARRPDRPRQPPGVPGGDGAAMGDGGPPRPDARPRHRRPRRLQADQRRPRPRGRRPAPARGGDDHRDLSAPLRPRLPGRWRRVRDHHAGHRRRGRPCHRPPPAGGLPRGRPRGSRRDRDLVLGRDQRRSRAWPRTATCCTRRPTPPCPGASATAGPA